MSRRAAGVALIAVTLLIVALSTGAAIYFLVAALLFSMLVIGLLTALFTLFTLSVMSHSPRSKVVRGENIAIRLQVRRRTILPVSEIVLHISSPMDDGPSGRLPIHLRPLSTREYRYALACPHRGQYTVGPSRVDVSDIFGLFLFSRAINGGETQLDVLPKVYTMQPMVLEAGDTGPMMRVQVSEDAASPSGVRAYQDGDVLKKVHWKLTMRKRELMVRTYEESARPDTLILLDVSPVNAIRSLALAIEDALCEIALSMAMAQLKADHPVRMPLMTAKPVEPTGTHSNDFPKFMDAVSKLVFNGTYPYEQVLALAMRRTQRTGGAILVTSKLSATIADIALKMHRFGMRVQFIWITESSHSEALELLTRMKLGGIETRKIDPWSTFSLQDGRDSA